MRCSVCDFCSEVDYDDGREFTIEGPFVVCSVCVQESQDLYPEDDDFELTVFSTEVFGNGMAGIAEEFGPENEESDEETRDVE